MARTPGHTAAIAVARAAVMPLPLRIFAEQSVGRSQLRDPGDCGTGAFKARGAKLAINTAAERDQRTRYLRTHWCEVCQRHAGLNGPSENSEVIMISARLERPITPQECCRTDQSQ